MAPAPQVNVQTTEDPDGNVVAQSWIYVFPADDTRGLPGYVDSLNVFDGEWKNVSKAQRLNEMKARYTRWADMVLNPPAPEPVAPDDALVQAADALAQAQQAVQAALDTSSG